MKKNAKTVFLFLMTVIAAAQAKAQDLHFSQYFNAPLLVNPANTGFEPEADWRAGINYRNQWAGIINNPYKTMSAWGDAQLFNNRFENGWAGAGLALLKDVAGSGELSSTKVYGSFAYHQMLGYNSLLSGGFGLGVVNKSIDITKLTFNDQWNGKFFDVTIPTSETFSATSIWYLDLNAGLNYAVFPTDNAYLNAGISVNHINMPRESFFSNTDADAKVPMRFNVFANGSFKLNDRWIANPNAYFSMMSKSTEIVGGLNAHYNLSGDGAMQLIGGLYYRASDAIIPMVGVVISGIAATVSYDATSSSLGTYSQTLGAYEISLTKTGLFSESGSNVKCPSIKF
ncbi:PorP/SprF family type IX secretion system membrane protein [Parafilimonas sp.]|uniref:PorP/SprF family type IX secretion system membrane protein n=1 Tax=Parafilimonas sp. TaxID=1969739 RepID=UPI0039E33A7F